MQLRCESKRERAWSVSEGALKNAGVQKQQTTIRQPIECAPEASRGGRESMDLT